MVRVVLKIKGFNELRNSPEVMADLQRRAEAIADAAGDGFVVSPVGADKTRAHVRVYASTEAARRAEANDAALTRAIDAGRA